jgi:aminoglycoside 3-N-acetyltransferase
VAVFGKRAKDFVRGEELATTPAFPGGVWQRLYDERATILLLGVGLNRNTYIHAVDEMIDLPDRLDTPISLTVIDYDGKRYELTYQKHGQTGSEFFENYRKPLEELGALKNDRLGNAEVGIFDTVSATEIIKRIWSRAEYNICDGFREIPESYYR